MSFFAQQFGQFDPDKDDGKPDDIRGALRKGEQLRAKIVRMILSEVEGYVANGQFMEASVMSFAAILGAHQHFYAGVENATKVSQAEGGGKGVVKELWELMEKAAKCMGEEDPMAALARWKRENKG